MYLCFYRRRPPNCTNIFYRSVKCRMKPVQCTLNYLSIILLGNVILVIGSSNFNEKKNHTNDDHFLPNKSNLFSKSIIL